MNGDLTIRTIIIIIVIGIRIFISIIIVVVIPGALRLNTTGIEVHETIVLEYINSLAIVIRVCMSIRYSLCFERIGE